MPILPRRLAAFAALAMLPLGAACASGEEGRYEASPQDHFATLIVENDESSNMTVYVLRNGRWQRMGTVTGLSTERFQIRRSMLGSDGKLRVGIRPPGARCEAACVLLDPRRIYSTNRTVSGDDEIEVTVSSVLRQVRVNSASIKQRHFRF